jgi:hypothetical protein
VPELPCQPLVVYGSQFEADHGWNIASLYGSDVLAFPELDHWDLVLAPNMRAAIWKWLSAR